MRKDRFYILLLVMFLIVSAHDQLLTAQTLPSSQTVRYYLSGTDKDHTVEWDFFCTKGRKSGSWTKIAVPSNWEQQGFGGYNYGHDKIKSDEQGKYRHSFASPANWRNKKIFIVFEGVMTDTRVLVNGKEAGPVHQGGFYRFKYDITRLIKTGNNRLEVEVSKMSADPSVNKAERKGDFWVFGGIYRPVYLEIMPEEFIDRLAIDAKADGSLHADIYIPNRKEAKAVKIEVMQTNGTPVGPPFTSSINAGEKTTLRQQITGIKTWSPEFPSLYDLHVSLLDVKGNALHEVIQRFGFRTIEIKKHDGIYINGKRVILKGVNHHSEWPETGRTLSREIDKMDIELMKDMNMNAVRMSHYPPDQSFLDLCDSIGLFVLDELTGWQAKYDTAIGKKLVKELVIRDVNHPSILFWDNGNEGGFNRGLDDEFALYDPQQRLVLHPWERFNNFDTKHYPVYNYVANSALYDSDIFMPTEFMHGLYDGGHGAGLEDFWNLMMQHPSCAGGFLWAFHDEAILRTDKDSLLDTDGNHAPDGIVGPHREKEGSFYTIKEIWSPVEAPDKVLRADFDGRLAVKNHYSFTNLDQCTFTWKLADLATPSQASIGTKIIASGTCAKVNVAPGETGYISIPLPAEWRSRDVLYVTVTDPHQREIITWSWPVSSAGQYSKRAIHLTTGNTAIDVKEDGDQLIVQSDKVKFYFSKRTGLLLQAATGETIFPLANGPLQTGADNKLLHLDHYASDNDYVVEPKYTSDSFRVKWIFSRGKPVKLEYSYIQRNNTDFNGITFSYPEAQIRSMTWAGKGPYRVWKNRLKGSLLGVWHKEYNNTVTGESWTYPEFKGYHADMYWVKVEGPGKSFTVYIENDHLFLQMLRPAAPAGAGNANTSPAFPDGDLGFLHAIAPIGTKFKPAADMGPQSQQNMMMNYTPVSGILWFDFRP